MAVVIAPPVVVGRGRRPVSDAARTASVGCAYQVDEPLQLETVIATFGPEYLLEQALRRAGKRDGAVYELAQVVHRVRHVERWRGFSGDLVILARRLQRVEDLDQHGHDLADRLAERIKNVRCVDVASEATRRRGVRVELLEGLGIEADLHGLLALHAEQRTEVVLPGRCSEKGSEYVEAKRAIPWRRRRGSHPRASARA